MTFQNPLLQPVLILAEGQIPVLGRTLDESVAGVVLVGRVDKFVRRERGTALLALVAVGTLCAAAWTGTHDVAVGEELARHLVAVLLFGYLLQFALVVKSAEEVAGELMVYVAGGAAVYVERDAELLEGVLYHLVVAVHHFLYGDTLLTGTYGDGHAMLVRATDEDHLALLQTEVAHVDVGRDVNACEVSYVYAAIGIRQGGSDGGSFVILLFHSFPFLFSYSLFFVSIQMVTGPSLSSSTFMSAPNSPV